MIHLQANLAFSSPPIHSWRSQVCLHHSYCSDSFLPLKSRLVQIKCWVKQWRGLTWDDSYGHGHWCWRKTTASTNAAQKHLQQRVMVGGNLIRAGGNNTSRYQKTAPLFPPSCWHWWCLFYQIQILHKKGVTISETNSNSGYFLRLFKQCQCWIYFPQKDSRLSRTGWFLHQRTKNRFGPSQTNLNYF